MNYEYTCKKVKLDAKTFKEGQVFFRNGDYFDLLACEIIEIDVQFYDTLVAENKHFCPVAKSGFVKCKIINKPKQNRACVYNQKEYNRSRKSYLEQRCVNEGGIFFIRLFDSNNWHHEFFADVVATLEDGFLFLRFQENKAYGSFNSDYHTVNIRNLTKEVIEQIDLDFENCDSFTIYKNEIVDININFKSQLVWNSSNFSREIDNGFIRLKLNKENTWRTVNVYNCEEKIPNIKKLEKRLCGKGLDDCDICRIYVTYKHAGYCSSYEENIEIEDIQPIDKIKHFDNEDYFHYYISGYTKREDDGTILIVFGKSKDEL